jgi:hypothetical protein
VGTELRAHGRATAPQSVGAVVCGQGERQRLCVIATGQIRLAEVRELEAAGADYTTSRDALSATVPEGWRILSLIRLDD